MATIILQPEQSVDINTTTLTIDRVTDSQRAYRLW